MTKVHNRAMLVNLSISCWGGSKSDKTITRQVICEQEAKDDAGRFAKNLFPKEFLKDIVSTRNALRIRHNYLTSPWLDDGTRILSTLGYIKYITDISSLIGEFDASVNEFLTLYQTDEFFKRVASYLGKMYIESDYPNVDTIRTKFKAKYTVLPFPTKDDFRVSLPQAEIEAIQRNMETITQERLAACTRGVFERIALVLEKALSKLKEFDDVNSGDMCGEKRVIIRESLFRNIKDLADLIPSLNVEGDGRIDELAEDISTLDFENIKDIRENRFARQKAFEDVSEFYKKVTGYMV